MQGRRKHLLLLFSSEKIIILIAKFSITCAGWLNFITTMKINKITMLLRFSVVKAHARIYIYIYIYINMCIRIYVRI